MRRLLPLAVILTACAKPAETPSTPAASTPKATSTVPSSMTPQEMAKAMDVPLYPGAEAPDGLSSAPEKRKDGGTGYSLVLATKDPVDKAAGYYARELKLEATPAKAGKMVIGMSPKGNNLMITVAPEAGRTLIRLKSIAYPKS